MELIRRQCEPRQHSTCALRNSFCTRQTLRRPNVGQAILVGVLFDVRYFINHPSLRLQVRRPPMLLCSRRSQLPTERTTAFTLSSFKFETKRLWKICRALPLATWARSLASMASIMGKLKGNLLQIFIFMKGINNGIAIQSYDV